MRRAAAPARPGQPYQDASPTNVADAYDALKTYLMLGDKTRAEPSHLNDQMTRYWRGWLESNRGAMPREQMIRSAERLMTFYLGAGRRPGMAAADTETRPARHRARKPAPRGARHAGARARLRRHQGARIDPLSHR